MAEHTDSAAGAAAESGATGMPQLDFATFPNQIFWLVVTLVAVYFLLSRVAIPMIRDTMEDRDKVVSTDLEAAAELKAKAAEAEKAYEKALADARAEAGRIADEARAEIQKQIDEANRKADAEIAARTAESQKRIEEIRESATASVEEIAREIGYLVAENVLPGVADQEAIDSAVKSQVRR